MIVLDTNVISALMQRDPDPEPISWLDGQPAESVWTTAVTVFEVCFGIEILESGRRRKRLEDAFARALDQDLEGRVLAFDHHAARAAGAIAAERRRAGRPVEIRDLQIAGIVATRQATLATRNTRHFADLGIAIVNPWDEP